MSGTLASRKQSFALRHYLPGVVMLLAAFMVVGAFATGTVYGHADNFTDIFYTNSFRGAFDWIKKLDWVGMIVQCVISCFSLFGVALLVIRIMTSMLFLSAKGLWEEVHDLKSSGETAEKDFIGLFGMAKTWASGKSGTGLDAIIGAVMMILPDVKRYSDFGEKAGGDFQEDITISQYMLKIALPTVMTVFFFAMGFNGTLFQALAVTVDAMGTAADHIISVNYSGIVNDIINSRTGYEFYYDADGTNFGKFKQAAAKDMYTLAVAQTRDPSTDVLFAIGQEIENYINNTFDSPAKLQSAGKITPSVQEGLGKEMADEYVRYITCEVHLTGSQAMSNTIGEELKLSDVMAKAGVSTGLDTQNREMYFHLVVNQQENYNGVFFNNIGGGDNSGTTNKTPTN